MDEEPRDPGAPETSRADEERGATAASGGDPIEEAWARVEQQWDDAQAHDRFIELCLQLDRLPEAGRCYRQVRETDPQRRDEAQRRIERLLTLATQTLELSRRDLPDVNRTRRRLFFVALGLGLFMVLYAVWAWVGQAP